MPPSTGDEPTAPIASPRAPDAAAEALDRFEEGVLSLAADATVVHANAAVLRMWGRRLDDVVGHSLWSLFPHVADTPFPGHLERALSSGEVVEYEEFSPRLGSWLRRRFYPSAEGATVVLSEGPDSILARTEDHELRTSLVRAQEAERRYRDILDGMVEGLSETTPSGEFLIVNQSLATLLGYDHPDQLLAEVTNAAQLYVNPPDRSATISRITSGGTRVVDVEMRRRDGGSVWVRARATPVRGPDGEVTSMRGVLEDITEEREAEQRFREAEERIETRERTLLAEAVHDDPLQLIVAAILRLDVLQPQLDASFHEPVEHVATMLEQAVDRLRNLIVALSPPDLGRGLGVALSVLADGIFMGTSTTIEVTGPQHVPLAPEIKAQAYRVLREALINARKHASAGQVRIGLAFDDATVTLSVADDGVGGAKPSSDPGHLGMSSMWTRAEALNARLSITSPVGQGTSVELVVPRTAH